jgi:hypothetical protein
MPWDVRQNFGEDSVFVTGVPVLRLRRQTQAAPLRMKVGEKRVETGVVPGGTEPVQQFPEKMTHTFLEKETVTLK